MKKVIDVLVGFIAIQHFAFLILEMFLWEKPIGLKIFRMSVEVAKNSANLAANQGLYNGFLAAGLLWSLFVSNHEFSTSLQFFFLGCVAIAGLYGGYSVSSRIFYIQFLPAFLTLALLLKLKINS